MHNVTVSYSVGVSNSRNNREEKTSRENIPLKNVQWGSHGSKYDIEEKASLPKY